MITEATNTKVKLPKPPSTGAKPPVAPTRERRTFSVTSGVTRNTHKIGLYGQGKVGKTTLASLWPKPVLFLDLENGSEDLDVNRISNIETWDDLMDVLCDDGLLDGYDCLVIDTITKAKDLAVEWTLRNIKNSKGKKMENLKQYGWGDGDSHLFDTFLKFFGHLDRIAKTKNVIVIAHSTDENVPNPGGSDYLSYMPNLPKSKQGNVRSKFKEWADHLLFVEIEAHVDSDSGKAIGDGTRVLYPQQLPHAWAGSRILKEPAVLEEGSPDIWNLLLSSSSKK